MRIFFSWQSDLPREGNTTAIRSAARRAIDTLERETDLRFELLEGPGGSGAEEIACGLASQIRRCDMFLADVTLVTPPGAPRRAPNPNVMFELGLAAAEVGWERVIMLLNQEFGEPEHLPFDIRHRTVVRYRARREQMTGDLGTLAGRLGAEIRRVIADAPPRPREIAAGTVEEVQRARDLRWLERYFSYIDRTVIADHLDRGPHQRLADAVLMFDAAHAEVGSNTFMLNNRLLQEAVLAFDAAWVRSIGFDVHYRETSSDRLKTFGTLAPTPKIARLEQRALRELTRAHEELRVAWASLHRCVFSQYPEIDLEVTDRKARARLRHEDDD